MGNLSQMHHHGTKVACPCHAADCKPGRWIRLDLDDLIELCGDHYDLWNREPTCVHCGSTGHYLGSAGSVFVPHRDTTDEATLQQARHRPYPRHGGGCWPGSRAAGTGKPGRAVSGLALRTRPRGSHERKALRRVGRADPAVLGDGPCRARALGEAPAGAACSAVTVPLDALNAADLVHNLGHAMLRSCPIGAGSIGPPRAPSLRPCRGRWG